MSQKRKVKFGRAVFQNDYMRGPRIVMDHENTDYKDGDALITTSIDMSDEYAAMALLGAARAAVRHHVTAAANKYKMLNDALENRA